MADDTPPPPPAPDDALILFQAQRDPETRMLLARALAGEGNDPNVLISILNRARQSGQSVKDVLLTRGQFTSLDPKLGTRGLYGLSEQQLAPELALINRPLPANYNPNMTDFYNPTLLAKKHAEDPKDYPNLTPKFAMGKSPVASSGNQLFFEGQYKGGPLMATSTATGPTSSSAVNQGINAMQVPDLPPQAQASLDRSFQREEELEPQVSQALDQKADLYQQQYDAAVDYRKNLQGITDKFSAAQERLMDAMPDEEKERQRELAKVSDEPLDPTRVLGQFLPMIAAIGGAFTRAGAAGSLNAAAAAMNAARSHDDDALKRAHEQFQDRITEVMQKASMLHDEMTTALESSKGNWEAYLASMQVLAAKYDLPAAKLALERGNVQDLLNMRESLFKSANTIQEMNMRQADLEIKERELQLKEQQASASQFTPDANEYLSTLGRFGNLPGAPRIPPNLGMGDNPERARLANNMAEDAKHRWNTDDAQVAAMADIGVAAGEHAKAAGLVNLSKQIPPLQAYVNGLDNIGGLLKNAAGGKGAGQLWGSWWNKPLRALRTSGLGDKDTVQLNALAKAVQDEYAKVLSGATGSVKAASDSEIAQMQQIISGDMTPEQIYGVLDTMHSETSARLTGYQDAFNSSEQDITAEAERKAQAGGPVDSTGDESPTSTAPSSTAPSQFTFNAKDRADWESDVKTGREYVREHRKGWTKDYMKQYLKQHYHDIPDSVVDQATAGLP